MSKRKIFEKQIIDLETGEISSVTTITASKFNESFQMCRTTSGIEWVGELSGSEIKTIIFLLELEDLKTKLTTLGPVKRKELAEFLKLSTSQVNRTIKSLEDKAYLIRINKYDIVLNPKGFYKGSSKEIVNRITEFNKVYSSKFSAYSAEESRTQCVDSELSMRENND